MNEWINIRLWLYSLLSAAISGATGATSVVLIDPDHFNLHDGLTKLSEVAAMMAVIGVLNFLKNKPLPTWDGQDRRDVLSQSALSNIHKTGV